MLIILVSTARCCLYLEESSDTLSTLLIRLSLLRKAGTSLMPVPLRFPQR